MGMRLLRIFLLFAAAAWGVSVVGVFADWETATRLLQGLGAGALAWDPMLDYWLRMASAAFALVGCWYLVLAIWPSRFSNVIPGFGILMIVEGFVLLAHGIRLTLPPLPFYGDTAACFLAGFGILICSRHARFDA